MSILLFISSYAVAYHRQQLAHVSEAMTVAGISMGRRVTKAGASASDGSRSPTMTTGTIRTKSKGKNRVQSIADVSRTPSLTKSKRMSGDLTASHTSDENAAPIKNSQHSSNDTNAPLPHQPLDINEDRVSDTVSASASAPALGSGSGLVSDPLSLHVPSSPLIGTQTGSRSISRHHTPSPSLSPRTLTSISAPSRPVAGRALSLSPPPSGNSTTCEKPTFTTAEQSKGSVEIGQDAREAHSEAGGTSSSSSIPAVVAKLPLRLPPLVSPVRALQSTSLRMQQMRWTARRGVMNNDMDNDNNTVDVTTTSTAAVADSGTSRGSGPTPWSLPTTRRMHAGTTVPRQLPMQLVTADVNATRTSMARRRRNILLHTHTHIRSN